MRFLVDAQLPPALARWLSANGHQAEHVFDFGGDGTTDTAIWLHAVEISAVIVTKDEDFPHRVMQNANGPQVVWVRVGNTRRAVLLLLDWFGQLLPRIIASLERGERVIEIA